MGVFGGRRGGRSPPPDRPPGAVADRGTQL